MQTAGRQVYMVLKRKMLETLRAWRASKGAECLLIKGARQVGKSYIVAEFGHLDYESFVSIDFIESPELKEVFDGPLDADTIYRQISLVVPGARFVPGKTLLFLDEIQECPAARAALKYLALDGRCDVVASGSLLGIRFKEEATKASVPVGYEREIAMGPLDFEEYLWARGYDAESIEVLRGFFESREPVPSAVNQKMMQMLREYLAVGGMPAVVSAFVESNSFAIAHDEQRSLLASYLDDVARYAEAPERVRARACFESLPRQLAKENTKFQYSVVESRGTARKFGSSVDWLVGAGMVRRCQCVTAPQFPLAAYEDGSKFRLYAADTGVLMAMYGFEMLEAVVNNKLTGPMKGGLYENLIACMLAAKGVPLRYWRSQKGDREIEFVTDSSDASVVPVEVKASRGSTVSLNDMLERPDVSLGYKLIDGNVGQDGKKVTLPLYMAMFLG